jgi:hypothetical protein
VKTWLISVGREDVAIAAPSKKAAVAALNDVRLNWSLYAFNQYACDLLGDHPIAVMALAKPGVVFVRPNDRHDAEWTERTFERND